MNEFWKKFKPLGSQAALVWGIMLAVYAFYMVSFFWGNHDFRFMRYGFSSPWEDAWEARVTQYLPVWILSIGQILPIFNMLLATGFMSLGAILLAKWYGLEKPVNAVLFALLIGLHPYHLTQFYYVHQIISVALWHLLGIIGMVFLFQSKRRLYLLGIGLLLFSLMGYVSVVELIFTVFLCKVWLNGEKAFLPWLKVYFRAGIGVVITLSIYAVMIELLKQYGIINGEMYNTQTLPLSGIWDKFITQWSAPIKILFRGTPYLPKVAVWMMMLLSLVLSLWVGFRQKEFWFTFIGLVLISYAMLAIGYVSQKEDALYICRVHSYSVPYVIASGVAFIRLKGGKALRNMVLILACGLCFFYARADFEAQKNWFLGNKEDEFALERIRKEIIPQLQPEKEYRLSVMGGYTDRQNLRIKGIFLLEKKILKNFMKNSLCYRYFLQLLCFCMSLLIRLSEMELSFRIIVSCMLQIMKLYRQFIAGKQRNEPILLGMKKRKLCRSFISFFNQGIK
jgi:hypothetical protein